MHKVLATAILGFVSFGAAEVVSASPQQQDATDDDIRQLIQQLAAPEFVAREEATQALWRKGIAAEPLLREALESADKEVVARAGLILDRFRYGIFADSPQEVVFLVEQYRTGDRATRERVIQQLVTKRQIDVIERFIQLAANEDARQEVSNWVLGRFDRTLAPLLMNGETDDCKRLLLIAANSPDDIATCTALHYQLGDLDEGIAYLRARLSDAASKDDANDRIRERRLLSALLRANGDTASSLSILPEGEEFDTEKRNLLIVGSEWQLASDQAASKENSAPEETQQIKRLDIESLTFEAVIHHLAGETDRRDAVMKAVLEQADNDESVRLYAAECLYAVDRYEEAIQMTALRNKRDAFSVLTSQHRYQDAFAIYDLELTEESITAWIEPMLDADMFKSQEGVLRIYEALTVIGQLVVLGEREQAGKHYQHLADLALSTEPASYNILLEIVRQEFLLGFEEQAFVQMAELFQTRRYASSDPLRGDFARRTLFSNNSVMAAFWWRTLSDTHQDAIERSKKIKLLLDKRFEDDTPDAETQEAISSALARIRMTPELQRYRDHILLADYCSDVGLTLLAEEHYRRAFDLGDSNSALKLGDLAREDQEWRQAADWYGLAYQRNPTLAIAMYLQAHCLTQLGEADQADELRTKALLISLPSSRANSLADALLIRDLPDDAEGVWKRVIASAEPLSSFYSDAYGRLGNIWNGKDPVRAAEAWQQVYVGVMRQDRNFVSQSGYLNMAELIHHSLALDCLANDDIDAAMQHIEFCKMAEPGNTQVAEDFVPKLEALGRQDDADALFDSLAQQHLNALELFPNSALHHNNLAWLSARCERNLDDAMAHAKEAVRLEPESSNYLDTLAEVTFLKGDAEAAAELAKQCIAIEPTKLHYREQLERFTKALEEQNK